MILKEIIRRLIYVYMRKSYKQKMYISSDIVSVRDFSEKEYFYGYYDKAPERKNKILFHEMNDGFVNIIVKDIRSNIEQIIGKSTAYNWQLGSRALWIDDDTIAYNDFDGAKYVTRLYSINQGEILSSYEKSMQDYSCRGFFLGVNYQRLRSYAKEYGYYSMPELSEKDFLEYSQDGIWYIDKRNGECKLLLSIQQIIDFEAESRFVMGKHFLNHIMISPNGDSFIFIHRYYVGKERFDRLLYYNFKELRCLFRDKLQSHYCWLDNNTIFGYGGYQGKNEFHTIDIRNGQVEICEKLTALHPKDGHPTKYGDWVIVDSYPYLNRMQELVAYNMKTKEYKKILEVFHDMKHKGFDRCDLHPRFSSDGKYVFFDTLFKGKRNLCYIDVSTIVY